MFNGDYMTKEQKQLLESSDNALDALYSWYRVLSKDGETDMSKMVKAAYDIFSEMRSQWTFAIGHPQGISKDTLIEIMEAVHQILTTKIANGTL